MKEIAEWLEAGGLDYARGLALYEAHGSSSVVLSTLRYGQTEFTRQKLRAELRRLVEGPAPAAPAAPAPAPAPAAPAPTAPLPDEEARRRQRSSWFAERHRLHAQLELLATDEERKVAAERIVVLSELLTQSYQGPAPAKARSRAQAAPLDLSTLTDVGELRRTLTNRRALASKLKKNPARALDLQQVQADIKILETKLLKP